MISIVLYVLKIKYLKQSIFSLTKSSVFKTNLGGPYEASSFLGNKGEGIYSFWGSLVMVQE